MTDLQKLEAVRENYAKFLEAERNLLEWKERAERATRPVQEMYHSGHAKNWREDAVIQMIEARDNLADTLNEYIDSWIVARAVIYSITDPGCLEVLFRRYIQGYTWMQIAAEMGCSRRNCMILHRKAINGLQKEME